MNLLREIEKNPITRPVDKKKLARKPYFTIETKKGRSKVETIVSVPEKEEVIPRNEFQKDTSVEISTHTKIQYYLLKLGANMGFNIWVARNDQSKTCNGEVLGNMQRIVTGLPTQFNEVTDKTIKLIDVLWLKGNSIIAAFEIESTTSIYSGLLRMNDLIVLQPNLNIDIFIIAPEERREKVEQEIIRPTFALREKPLAEVCGFISFNELIKKVEGIKKLGLATSLKPDFLKNMAEYFTG